ncbi:MAG: hypothetical protein ACLPYS_17070 [Vulcanimicrobiaceae bacterium]
MTLSITRAQRSLLFFFSASGYIAWCSGLDGRLAAQIVAAPRLATLASLPERPPPRVSSIIRRDPFAEERADIAPVSVADSGGGDLGAPAATVADDGVTVPNIADLPGGDAPVPQTLVLKATIVGPNPVAYVQDGSGMDIVRVGDLLGGRRVRRIDLQSIELNDGSRLELPGMFAAPPAAPNPSLPAGIPGRTVRKQVVEQQSASAAPSAVPSPPPPQPTPRPGYPSPGPLPTVNRNGIPVGVNPTPDLNAATAYPYPYPYPPQQR